MTDAAAWLPAGALAATVVAVLLEAASLRGTNDEAHTHATRARLATWVAAALTIVAFLELARRFIAAEVTTQYVFLYTRADLPLRYRIAGTWAGREGSLLLWTLFLGLVAALVARSHHLAGRDLPAQRVKARTWMRLFVLVHLGLFLLAVVRQDTFAPTPDFFLEGRPLGNGLNPTLLSPFILIHPPIEFAAYALAALPAAAALAHLVTGAGAWSRDALAGSRQGWVLATAGLGLGGIWAYYTLGFGGYWAWDPVEVANLLPWLAWTLYLHAQVHHLRHGRYQAIGPFLAILPLLLTLFSTISTRSGLWVSVHAFTDPTNTFNPDAAGRFLDILAVEPQLLPYVGLFVALYAGALALWCRRLAADHGTWPRASRGIAAMLGAVAAMALVAPSAVLSGAFEVATVATGGRTSIGLLVLVAAPALAAAGPLLAAQDEPAAPPKKAARKFAWLTETNLLYAALLAMGSGLLVIFLFAMATVNGWNRAFWDARVPYLLWPVLLLLVLYQSSGTLGRKRALVATGLAAVLGLGAAAAFPGHRLGALLVAAAVGALWAGLDRMRRVAGTQGRARWRLANGLLLLALVLDLTFWLNPTSQVGWGALTWRPVWPVQFFLGSLAAALLAVTLLAWSGHARARRRWVPLHLGAAALGGYVIAAPFALLALWLRREAPQHRTRRAAAARLKPIVIAGLHVALTTLALGFVTSTYFADELREEVAVGEELALGPYTLMPGNTTWDQAVGSPFQDTTYVAVQTEGLGGAGAAQPLLYWEPQTASHYPLPATLRFWHSDLYFDLDAICFDPDGDCEDLADWITSYEAGPRILEGQEASKVRLHALALPGLSLVWSGLALLVIMGSLLAWGSRHDLEP
ncbi:MAG: cytochrome c biogenesis protein CcsA [Thermoplasmatota archaeon]